MNQIPPELARGIGSARDRIVKTRAAIGFVIKAIDTVTECQMEERQREIDPGDQNTLYVVLFLATSLNLTGCAGGLLTHLGGLGYLDMLLFFVTRVEGEDGNALG